MSIKEDIIDIAREAKEAARLVANLSSKVKNEVLISMADELIKERDLILKENKKDLNKAVESGLSKAMIDRLTLNDSRINEMANSLREVAALPDPVGEVTKMWKRPNNLLVGKMRIPLGVIGIIYESRPNVTVDASGLCLKAGNSVILRGGSEAFNSNMILTSILKKALESNGIPKGAIMIIPTTDREAIKELLYLDDFIDLIIPRGGEELIRFVANNSKIPVIKHYKGVCHIFVDETADIDMAIEVCYNAKVQRPGVCNAMETLLVHKNIAKDFLPKILSNLKKANVEIRGCKITSEIFSDVTPANEEDWYAEYLDLVLAVKVVDGIDEAIDHITKYGSMHTEAIITNDYNNAQKFLKEVNSCVVLVNASTRFSDGYQLGLGAEIGISTSKIHSFGPMGVEDLTTTKFIIYGDGQIRG
jgi:glutamate-5-semialdehyde dehydrogenase